MRWLVLCMWLVSSASALAGPESAGGESHLLRRFLATEQPAVMRELANWLETYSLSDAQVEQLITAARLADSDERRIVLWHAIRCTRSHAGQQFLLKNVVEDSDERTRIRFVQSLTNLAPADVPLLTALYRSRHDDGDELLISSIGDEIVRLATRDEDDLVAGLSPQPEFLNQPAEQIYAINQSRSREAEQAKSEMLCWLARNAATEEHRLAVIVPALETLESSHQKQLAADIMEIVTDPEERARVIPSVCRLYAFDPYPLLVDDREDETVKLGVIRGLQMFASAYGYSISTVDHGRETLKYVIRTDPSPRVREAAVRLLQRVEGRSPGAEPE